MNENSDVLVVTPPRKALTNNIIIDKFPPNNQGIDSVPLRLAAVIETMFTVGYYPFYYTQYNYYQINQEEIIEILKKYNPKVLVIATDYFISNRTTSTFMGALVIAKLFKKFNKTGYVIITGKHAIVKPMDYFMEISEHSVDVVISSEPEMIITQIIKDLLVGELHKLYSYPNLYIQEKEVTFTYHEIINVDFNQLPSPAFHLLAPYIDYLIEKEPMSDKLSITLRTSYGCVYECPFCGGLDNWNCYRTRSAENIRQDIRYLNETLHD